MLRLSPSHHPYPHPTKSRVSGRDDSSGLTGSECKGRERIHRGIADPRLLAIPPSWRRVSASNPNWARLLGISSALRPCNPLYLALYHVCRPRHKGHADLTSSPPSSGLKPAVPCDTCNTGQGLRSLCHLRLQFTPRADDGHAAPVLARRIKSGCPLLSKRALRQTCQAWVRFFGYYRIEPHGPPLVRPSAYSFEFRPCGRTSQAGCLTR